MALLINVKAEQEATRNIIVRLHSLIEPGLEIQDIMKLWRKEANEAHQVIVNQLRLKYQIEGNTDDLINSALG